MFLILAIVAALFLFIIFRSLLRVAIGPILLAIVGVWIYTSLTAPADVPTQPHGPVSYHQGADGSLHQD